MIIYKATNKINGKIYIGQTIKSLKKRANQHKILAEKATYLFPRAIAKYGFENFDWEILETCSNQEELDEAETKWIKNLNSQNKNIGYNICSGANPGKEIGQITLSKLWKTEEFRNKMKTATRAGSRKLTDQDIGIIKEAYCLYPECNIILAKIFNISNNYITEIALYENKWKDIKPLNKIFWPIGLESIIENKILNNKINKINNMKKQAKNLRKINEETISSIKYLGFIKINHYVISEYFKIDRTSISKIISGKSYAEINMFNFLDETSLKEIMELNEKRILKNKLNRYDIKNETKYGENHHSSKLSNNDILQIIELYKNKFSLSKISSKFNISKTVVSKIVNKKIMKTCNYTLGCL